VQKQLLWLREQSSVCSVWKFPKWAVRLLNPNVIWCVTRLLTCVVCVRVSCSCRSVAPPSMSSTASAIYLSVRNIIGGLGPLAVAQVCACA